MAIKNKTKKNGGRIPLRQALGPLRQSISVPLRQALGAPLRQALGTPLRQALGASIARNKRLFTDAAINAAFDFTELAQNQPKIDLWKMPFIPETDPSDESIPHDKIDINSIILQRTSSTITKFGIRKLIAAFLTVLIETSLGKTIDHALKEIKHDTDTVVNETTEAIYDYMIKTASEKIQEGDTTIIATLYEKLGQYISPDARKRVLEKLVIDGESFGWLAQYDALIDQWLKKIIEIKGGKMPSDKYIITLLNIIHTKVLPVSNTIWYYTNSDNVPESYWFTSEGLMKTATGMRQMLAEDTLISKIVIGILSATEVVIGTQPVGNIFGDINTMIQTLIIKIKSDIANSNGGMKLDQIQIDISPVDKPYNHINRHLSELKVLEQYLDKTKTYMQKNKLTTKWPAANVNVPMTKNSAIEIQHMGAFDLFQGGNRKSRRRRHRSRHHSQNKK